MRKKRTHTSTPDHGKLGKTTLLLAFCFCRTNRHIANISFLHSIDQAGIPTFFISGTSAILSTLPKQQTPYKNGYLIRIKINLKNCYNKTTQNLDLSNIKLLKTKADGDMLGYEYGNLYLVSNVIYTATPVDQRHLGRAGGREIPSGFFVAWTLFFFFFLQRLAGCRREWR